MNSKLSRFLNQAKLDGDNCAGIQDNLEDFARLIVNECAGVPNSVKLKGDPFSNTNLSFMRDRLDMQARILKHFGMD